MAKNTHSQEALTYTSDSYTLHEESDPTPPVTIQRAMLGEVRTALGRDETEGDLELVGMDYSESSENDKHSEAPTKGTRPAPVQTTENPSSPPKREGSIAPTTGGAGRKTMSRQSGKKPTSRVNVRSVDSEDEWD